MNTAVSIEHSLESAKDGAQRTTAQVRLQQEKVVSVTKKPLAQRSSKPLIQLFRFGAIWCYSKHFVFGTDCESRAYFRIARHS